VVDLVPFDRAVVGQVEAGQEVGEGGLAGAVLADQGDDFALLQFEVDPGQRRG
jgi:hypothetical protein